MSGKRRVLLVEDDADVADALVPVLEDEGYSVRVESRGETALDCLPLEDFDLVLTDLRLPGVDGLEMVRRIRVSRPLVPVVLMTAHGTTETAIEATKLGAFDYLLKPFELPELLKVMHSAVEARRRTGDTVALGEAAPGESAIVGSSRRMREVYKEIGRLAQRPVGVLIQGETGTGKELVARALVQHGQRLLRPFITVNCAAIPDALLESELFGHERGAFTGADVRRPGRFEQANGGTLFLDEVGDLTPAIQAKLLRVLQEGTFQRLGGRETIQVDVRMIAATNRDLEAMIRAGEFREDLYYRLAVAVIRVPPLRERLEDLPDLIDYFGQRHGPELGNARPTFTPAAVEALRARGWPGNVRELENVVRKAILRSQGYPVAAEHLDPGLEREPATWGLTGPGTPEGAAMGSFIRELLDRAEAGEVADVRSVLIAEADRALLGQAMDRAKGNLAQAARWLGISRFTLRERLRELGLRPDR